MRAALAPYDAGSLLNFAERPTDPARFFAPDVLERLRAVKRAVDPEDRIRSQHPLA